MKPLSQQLTQLSDEVRKAEERLARVQKQSRERIEISREEIRREAKAALDKVDKSIGRAGEEGRMRMDAMKAMVDSDFEHVRDRAQQARERLEAWQARNLADDREIEARSVVAFAIATAKMAELATIDAVAAREMADEMEAHPA
jgi:hypothetical protein